MSGNRESSRPSRWAHSVRGDLHQTLAYFCLRCKLSLGGSEKSGSVNSVLVVADLLGVKDQESDEDRDVSDQKHE